MARLNQEQGSKGVALASERNAPRQVMFSSFFQPELRGLPARVDFKSSDLVSDDGGESFVHPCLPSLYLPDAEARTAVAPAGRYREESPAERDRYAGLVVAPGRSCA